MIELAGVLIVQGNARCFAVLSNFSRQITGGDEWTVLKKSFTYRLMYSWPIYFHSKMEKLV